MRRRKCGFSFVRSLLICVLKQVLTSLATLALVVAAAQGSEADTVSFPKDGVLVCFSVLSPLADGMQETYGFIPSVGIRGIFEAAPGISAIGGVQFLQRGGSFSSSWGGPWDPGERTRLRAAIGEFGVKVSSVPKARRQLFMEAGFQFVWTSARYRETYGDTPERDHNGTGLGFWTGVGTEQFLSKSLSWGVQGKVSLCSAGAKGGVFYDGWHRGHTRVDLTGIWAGAYLGFYR